jgi:hypothetical protein
MRHLKIYEDLFSQSKFAIGDIVRTIDNIGIFDIPLKPGSNYFEIIDILPRDVWRKGQGVDNYKYTIHNIIEPGYMDYYEFTNNLEIVPDYEVAGIKYNI